MIWKGCGIFMCPSENRKMYCIKAATLLLITDFLFGFGSKILDKLYSSVFTTTYLRGFLLDHYKTGLSFCIGVIILVLSFVLFGREIKTFAKTFLSTQKNIIKSNAKNTLLIGLVSFFAQGVANVFLAASGVLSKNQTSVEGSLMDSGILMVLLFIAYSVIIGPAAEEIVYRYGISKFFKDDAIIVPFIVSAITFGLAHVWPYVVFDCDWAQLLAAIPYTIMGAGFYLIYKKTNNLCYSFLLHAALNVLSAAATLLQGG